MKSNGKTYEVRKMSQEGDSKCQMTMADIRHDAGAGMFLFVDSEMKDATAVNEKDLAGASEIMLTSRLVGG